MVYMAIKAWKIIMAKQGTGQSLTGSGRQNYVNGLEWLNSTGIWLGY